MRARLRRISRLAHSRENSAWTSWGLTEPSARSTMARLTGEVLTRGRPAGRRRVPAQCPVAGLRELLTAEELAGELGGKDLALAAARGQHLPGEAQHVGRRTEEPRVARDASHGPRVGIVHLAPEDPVAPGAVLGRGHPLDGPLGPDPAEARIDHPQGLVDAPLAERVEPLPRELRHDLSQHDEVEIPVDKGVARLVHGRAAQDPSDDRVPARGRGQQRLPRPVLALAQVGVVRPPGPESGAVRQELADADLLLAALCEHRQDLAHKIVNEVAI